MLLCKIICLRKKNHVLLLSMYSFVYVTVEYYAHNWNSNLDPCMHRLEPAIGNVNPSFHAYDSSMYE